MTKIQLYNLHIFAHIFTIDNNIIDTSPDYIKEKSFIFFGQLGKNKFIEFKNKKHEAVYLEYWKIYCETWGVKENNYELLNIILFLIYLKKEKNIIKRFELYIGNLNIINNLDLKYIAHENILIYINNTVDFENRYFKLKTL